MSDSSTPVIEPQEPAAERWAVVVVHGVGETDPGQTLNRFLPEFLRQRGLPENTVEERKTLKEDGGAEFPLAMRRVDLRASNGAGPASPSAGGPKQAIFGEVFWADLSRAGDTPWDLLVRLFNIIFRVYYLVHQAARMPGLFSWLLRLSLYSISGILCGPIAALNAFMLILLVAHFAFAMLEYDNPAILNISAVGLGAVGLAILFLIPASKKKGTYPWTLVLLCLALVGSGATMMGILQERDVIGKPWTTPGVSVFLGYFEFLLALTRWCFLPVGGLAGLAVVFWLFGVLSCLFRPRWRRYIPGLSAGLTATLLQLGMWVILVPTLALAGLQLFVPDQLEEPPLNQLWSFFLFNLAAGLIVLVAGLVAWLWRIIKLNYFLSSADPPRRGDESRKVPRILVHWLILAALIVATLVGIGTFVSSLIFEQPPMYHETLDEQREWVAPMLAVLMVLVLIGFFYRPVRNALHILMDIISHFHRSSVRFPWYIRGREKGKPLPGEDTLQDYFIQQRIENRFEAVVRELLADGKVTHVTVIGHSQGALIAAETLWFWELYHLLEREKRERQVYLMTMGSPMTHLYQHYFPWRYGPLFPAEQPPDDYLQPWGKGIRRSVDVWINMYRINDFIGTHVDGLEGFPENLCFPKVSSGGGHAGYWSDPTIVAEMLPYLPG